MPDVYCNDGGSNTSPYDTWAKAATTLKVTMDYASAGDDVWIQSDHNEELGANTTYTSAGTVSNPIRIISVKNTNEPPVSGDYESMVTQGTGEIDGKASGARDIIWEGFSIWVGLNFIAGDDLLFATSGVSIFYDCKFSVDDMCKIGNNAPDLNDYVYFFDCDYVQVTIGNILLSGGTFEWRGGSFTFNGGSLTYCFGFGGSKPGNILAEDVDFSGLAVDDFIVNLPSSATLHNALIKRCKVPSFTSGGLATGSIGSDGSVVKFHSVSNSDIIYQFKEYYAVGEIEEDTAVYLNATYDGTNGYSAKMASNASAREWARPLRFKLAEIYSAANPTITVEMVLDSATALNNDDFWLEIEYPDGTIGAFGKIDFTSKPATILTTPSALASSSVSWAGTGGFTDEQKRKIAEVISGGGAGIHTIWACLAKPSTTVYVDPKITLS